MLKSLSAHYQVHFISAEKLSKADVARVLLSMIPQRFAEKIGVCPVVFDATKHALTVVTADPDDVETMKEVQLASGAREVKAVLARPAAVRALISIGRCTCSFTRCPVSASETSCSRTTPPSRSHGERPGAASESSARTS
jgi:hypothetical protein